jgi:hypothetical protein
MLLITISKFFFLRTFLKSTGYMSTREYNTFGKRRSRYSDYELSTARASRKNVNFDGYPMTEVQILAKEYLKNKKKNKNIYP